MQLDTYIEALQADLAEIAAVGDDATAEVARRLTAALRSALGLRLLDALGEAALELSEQLPAGHVEVRMAGQEPAFVYIEEEHEAAPGPEDGLTARISLRLPEGLKAAIEAAAAREGVSVNAWLVRALARSVGTVTSARGPGSRLTGYARS